MTSRFCDIILQAPAYSLRFGISNRLPKLHCSTICSSSFSSSIHFVGSQRRCFRSSVSNLKNSCHKTSVNSRCSISLWSQNVNMRLSFPNQSKSRFRMQRRYTCAGLIVGLLVCYSAGEPVHAEASGQNNCDSSTTGYSHGKKVYTDYSVIGIPGDGRCLFRSVAHGACLRSGNPPPDETIQRQLADELRASVADEFVKRREETEWFIEGDFDTYVARIRKPHVWGGEPELLMATHVLQMPISVYMYDQDSRGLIPIAEYGQEYGKDNPIKVLYYGSGHYDALHIPGKKSSRSKL